MSKIKIGIMKTPLIAFMILLFLPITSALDYRNTCDDNATLRKFMNFTSCEGNNCTNYNNTQLIECQFGCDNVTHVCRKAKIYEYGEFFIGIMIIMILAGLLLTIFKKYG